MTVPWDLAWPAIDVDLHRQLDLLDLRRFAVFALLGLATTMAMIERLGSRPQAIGEKKKRGSRRSRPAVAAFDVSGMVASATSE